jgi:hypothetical protein
MAEQRERAVALSREHSQLHLPAARASHGGPPLPLPAHAGVGVGGGSVGGGRAASLSAGPSRMSSLRSLRLTDAQLARAENAVAGAAVGAGTPATPPAGGSPTEFMRGALGGISAGGLAPAGSFSSEASGSLTARSRSLLQRSMRASMDMGPPPRRVPTPDFTLSPRDPRRVTDADISAQFAPQDPTTAVAAWRVSSALADGGGAVAAAAPPPPPPPRARRASSPARGRSPSPRAASSARLHSHLTPSPLAGAREQQLLRRSLQDIRAAAQGESRSPRAAQRNHPLSDDSTGGGDPAAGEPAPAAALASVQLNGGAHNQPAVTEPDSPIHSLSAASPTLGDCDPTPPGSGGTPTAWQRQSLGSLPPIEPATSPMVSARTDGAQSGEGGRAPLASRLRGVFRHRGGEEPEVVAADGEVGSLRHRYQAAGDGDKSTGSRGVRERLRWAMMHHGSRGAPRQQQQQQRGHHHRRHERVEMQQLNGGGGCRAGGGATAAAAGAAGLPREGRYGPEVEDCGCGTGRGGSKAAARWALVRKALASGRLLRLPYDANNYSIVTSTFK